MARAKLAAVQSTVLDTVTGEEPDITQADAYVAPYVLVGDASIPVSKKAGKRWENKIKDALQATTTERALWDEGYADYRRVAEPRDNQLDKTNLKYQSDTDENLTRENVKLLLRTTYTRNPKIELSTTDEARKPMAKCIELVLSALMNRKTFPGLNAKARIRRAVVHAHLTNLGVLKIGYQERAGSRQEALQELYRLREKLSKAKDGEDMETLYAELEQNEDSLPLYTDQGMWLRTTLPHRLIIDPNCTSIDTSDAQWIVEECFEPTALIKSKFMEKREDGAWVRKTDGKVVSSFNDRPHQQGDSAEDIKANVVALVDGYTSNERLDILAKDASRCYYVYDKLTREISFYLADDMTYPLWVWEDNMKLSRFYPHHLIGYTEPLDGIIQPGESSQYSGHVREVNKINKRQAFIRMLAFGAFIYNKKAVKPEAVTTLINFVKNPEKFEAFGVEWDPAVKLADVFSLFVPPDAQLPALYDKTDLMKSIDRINAVSSTARGEQFKTNTTNKAVETYAAQTASVANELTDVVEDALEELAWSMCEIIVSKYTPEQVASLIGAEEAKAFKSMTVDEFNANFGLAVAAGSTEKPTSENKKKEAIQIAQGLGQFAQAAPLTTMRIVSRMFSEAFSEFLVTDDDWKMFEQEMTKALAQPQAQPSSPPSGPGGQPPTVTSPVTATTGQ